MFGEVLELVFCCLWLCGAAFASGAGAGGGGRWWLWDGVVEDVDESSSSLVDFIGEVGVCVLWVGCCCVSEVVVVAMGAFW